MFEQIHHRVSQSFHSGGHRTIGVVRSGTQYRQDPHVRGAVISLFEPVRRYRGLGTSLASLLASVFCFFESLVGRLKTIVQKNRDSNKPTGSSTGCAVP